MTHDPHYARACDYVEMMRRARSHPYVITFVDGEERIVYEVSWRPDGTYFLYRKQVQPLNPPAVD